METNIPRKEQVGESAYTPHPDIIPDTFNTQKKESPELSPLEIMLNENQKRFDNLFLLGIDQLSGKGLPRHDYLVTISDYDIPEQYLTKEVYENKLYKKVATLGSIKNYVEFFNTVHAAELQGTELTAEQVAAKLMLIRIKRDPSFAFYVCFKIQDKVSGRNIPFRLNYAQIILLEKLEEMRMAGEPIRLILLKARQWGGSTCVQLYMAWIQLFLIGGWNSVILAQTKDTAKRIKAMYTRVLKNFPAGLVFGVPGIQFSPHEKSTSDHIITDKSGVVVRDNVITVASYENFESTRGANFAMMHGSEVAYWVETQGKSAESLITNISSGMLERAMTLEVLESTANGMSGYFYDEYQLAKEGKSNRKHLFIPFFYLPNDTKPFRTEEEKVEFAKMLLANKLDTAESATTESGEYLYDLWRKGATLEGINWYIGKRAAFHDHASMASEAPSDDVECFKHSGHTVFNQYLVDKYAKEYAREPMYKGDVISPDGKFAKLGARDEKGLLWIWQYADITPMSDRYMVVVDVGGRTTKADFSVITVVDRLPLVYGGKMEVVARWRGHIRYDFLALKAVLVARLYANALLVFESNTFDKKRGESADFSYDGDHTRGILATIEEEYSNLYMRNSTSPEDLKIGRFKKIGFQTNAKTKQDMVDLMIVSFEDNSRFLDPDIRVYKEMGIYEQREDGSYGNIVGKDNHDDILMTDMIANLVSDELPLPTTPKAYDPLVWANGTINESLL